MNNLVKQSRIWVFAIIGTLSCLVAIIAPLHVSAWPAASLEGRQANCLGCHVENDTWQDSSGIVIDIIDPATGTSYRQPDGSFAITVKRNTELRVKSVFGVSPGMQFPPDTVGWLYVDPGELQNAPEAGLKFAPGWLVNRPFCGKRLVETVDGYIGNRLAAITMTLKPLENAQDAEIQLQVLFKSNARGMEGSYYQKKVLLKVLD